MPRSSNRLPEAASAQQRGVQNLKTESLEEGEAVLKGSRYVPHMVDDNNVAFSTGRLMWSEDRFKNIPGRLGHAEYEGLCRRIGETSKWELSRPESKFEAGFAEYTTRPMDWERRIVRLPMCLPHRPPFLSPPPCVPSVCHSFDPVTRDRIFFPTLKHASHVHQSTGVCPAVVCGAC